MTRFLAPSAAAALMAAALLTAPAATRADDKTGMISASKLAKSISISFTQPCIQALGASGLVVSSG